VIRPYGTWPSPISPERVASQTVRLGAVAIDGGDIYWLEGRPQENGRNVLVRLSPPDGFGGAGRVHDVVPADANVRSRVHEYGGGAYAVDRGNVYYSNFSDQRIYRATAGAVNPAEGGLHNPAEAGLHNPAEAGLHVVPLTPEGAWYYADYAVDRLRNRLVCVREDHSGPGEAITTLVSVPLSGGSAGDVLALGHDFYSTPRFSPDGAQLCWLAWRHPNMPWDGTELWIADITANGALSDARTIAGGDDESIYQPGWGPDGRLYFVSDREGWWRIFRSDRSDWAFEPVLTNPPVDAEFGRPQWVFGTATWVFVSEARMLAAYTRHGRWFLADIDPSTGEWHTIDSDLEPRDWMAADPVSRQAVIVAASPARPDAVIRFDLSSGRTEVLRTSASSELDREDVSLPKAVDFTTGDGDTAHALYYPPANASVSGPTDERPPLIAISHGGPTAAANSTLDLKIQFWTSRGFAVVDVNYRGSSGFGRQYRNKLRGRWGVAEVDDMAHAVRHLVAAGLADESRLIIRGGSAGGYTTLASLTFQPGVFKAGASYYGVSDLEVLARDTHKFEARYLDRLIGPYPEARASYRARSPIHFVDRLACPIILLQGLEDRVVPPNQSTMMAGAARAKGLPVAYLTFEGEQHGFRKAETIVRSLQAELYFYGAVFGFRPSDLLPAIQIDNLSTSHGDPESRS
jgi:dipeptidyl aminopeptidase/acylaminoacyl peptidase